MKLLLPFALAGSLIAAPASHPAKHIVPAVMPVVRPTPVAVAPIKLAPHRAIYEIALSRTRPGGVVAATGRTVIEFKDVCTGWTTTQRFVADMTNAQGDPTRTDFIARSWESKDGRAMRFAVRNSIDGKTSQKFEGSASLAAGGDGTVALNIPRGKRFDLPVGSIMPTQHTMDVLRAAASGATGMHQLVFQGGDRHDLYEAAAIIGRQATKAELNEDRQVDRDGVLDRMSARAVLISYYPYNTRGAAADYEVAYRLYPNGVVSTMSLIYPNFTLRATLSKLERLAPDCRAPRGLAK